jgi:hypothetical protein
MRGSILGWFVGLVVPVLQFFYPALAALVGCTKYFFPHRRPCRRHLIGVSCHILPAVVVGRFKEYFGTMDKQAAREWFPNGSVCVSTDESWRASRILGWVSWCVCAAVEQV